jgi:lipooligosaccharide transport system ATP-binding protein
MDQPAVVARGLKKDYGRLPAVKGVDFTVPSRTCFGFLGPNGAGKTTTMRMISCIVPPTDGTLEVTGLNVMSEPRTIKSRIGVIQQEDNLDEEISVMDNLMIHARYHGVARKVANSPAA